MKGKTSLLLMEQVAMILVFAIAAAVCLQAFALSHDISRKNEVRGAAVQAAQNAAEVLKHHGGAPAEAFAAAAEILGGESEQDSYYVNYDKNWNVTKNDAVYRLEAREVSSGAEGLIRVEIRVLAAESDGAELIFALPAAWQEVAYGG